MDKFDSQGNKLCVGDRVLYIKPHYKEFGAGCIKKLNKEKATILCDEKRTYGNDS